jgi:hypothetical protein
LFQGTTCEGIPLVWLIIPKKSRKINVQTTINIQIVENLKCMLGSSKTLVLDDV